MGLNNQPTPGKTFTQQLKDDDESDPRDNVCCLYMSNFMIYFWVQMFISVALVTLYTLLTVIMGHNECHFDAEKFDGDVDPNAKPKKPEDLPNVTTTVQLCFMVGLTLHVLIFITNIYFEPHWRYYTAKANKGGFMAQQDESRRQQIQMARVSWMKSCAGYMDITLRVLLIGQAAFLLAFLFTNAIQYCAKDTSALRVEAQWGLFIALADLLIVPLMLIWRLCLDGTPSSGLSELRRLMKAERHAQYLHEQEIRQEEEQRLLSVDESDVDSDGNFNLHLKQVEKKLFAGTPREKIFKDDSYMDIDMFEGKKGGRRQKKRKAFVDYRKSPFYDEELGGNTYDVSNNQDNKAQLERKEANKQWAEVLQKHQNSGKKPTPRQQAKIDKRKRKFEGKRKGLDHAPGGAGADGEDDSDNSFLGDDQNHGGMQKSTFNKLKMNVQNMDGDDLSEVPHEQISDQSHILDPADLDDKHDGRAPHLGL